MVDIDFDKYVSLKAASCQVKEVSKYPSVNLDYTVIEIYADSDISFLVSQLLLMNESI